MGIVWHNAEIIDNRVCSEWVDNSDTDTCVMDTIYKCPNPSYYDAPRGPNSNTFACTVATACSLGKPNCGWTPGWGDTPRPYEAPVPPFFDDDNY